MGDNEMAASASVDDSRRKFVLGGAGVVGGLLAGVGGAGVTAAAVSAQADTDDTDPVVICSIGTLLDDKLVVRTQTSAAAQVRLELWKTSQPRKVFTSPWKPTGRGNTAELLNGRQINAFKWRWRVLARRPDGTGVPIAGPEHIMPLLPYSRQRATYQFGFGSCYRKKSPAPSFVAATAYREQLKFFAFLGDMGYPDVESNPVISQDYDGYSTYFREMIMSAGTELNRVTEKMPLYAVQDDHDLGCDDSGRLTAKDFAIDAFADLMPGVPPTGAGQPKTAHRHWQLGKVHYFMLDNRRDADELPNNCEGLVPPPPQNGEYHSVLGDRQRTWLKNRLRASRLPLKVIFAPRTLTWYWSAQERDELLDWIRDEGINGKILICSGDKHGSAFARPREDLNVWEMLCGPINVPLKHLFPRKNGVIWHDEVDADGRAINNATGVVEVDTSGLPQDSTFKLRWVTDDGSDLYTATI